MLKKYFNKKLGIYSILLTTVFSVYAVIIYKVLGNSFPFYNDSMSYYYEAYKLYKYNSLEAFFTLDGKVSEWGNFAYHGFAYSLLYGGIAKVIGWQIGTIQVMNILYTISVPCIFIFQKIELKKKLIFSILSLTTVVSSMFFFTYMQDSIHLLFSIIITLLIYKVSKNNRNYILLIIFILLATVFRANWIIWLFALVPFFPT